MIGKIIELPKITDPRGNLTVAEQLKDVPFKIRRAYWVYDVPGGESRGGHAHKRFHPWQGLIIETGTWRTLDDFSSGAVCLVLASEPYEEDDYIYDYDEFLAYVAEKPNT